MSDLNDTLQDVENEFYDLQISNFTLDEGAAELGFYFGLLCFCMFLLLDRIRGKKAKIEFWLLHRKLEVFKNDTHNSERVVNYLYYASLFYLGMPFFILFAWSLLILYDKYKEGEPLWPALCIILVGTSFILLGIGILRAKWSNYRMKAKNIALIFLALALITIY
jgi:hypothetical protein